MGKRFVLFLSLFVLLALLLSATASAHPVSVADGSRIDWFGRGPAAPNIGAIARDSAGHGEFVWTDARGDQRLASPIGATGYITREADLARFSITADANNLYFLAKMDRISGITNNPSPELMVAIDSDAAHTAGLAALPDGMATNVDPAAKWEYVVETQFTSSASTAKPVLYTNGSSGVCSACAAQMLSAATLQGSFLEVSVPWAQIGTTPAAATSLRFTVLTFYSDKRTPADGIASKAIDVVSPLSTADELSDNTANAYVDLHFDANGDVFAPLLISEFLPDPPTSRDPEGEWIELFNPNTFDVSLQGYKLGDQAYRGGSQGMLQLPNQTLAAGQALVVANNKAVFQSRYPSVPAGQIVDMTTLVPYSAWASGSVSLQNTNNGQPFKESIALLDPRDTLVDLVQYTTPVRASGLDPDNRPVVLAGTSVTPNASYERCPSSLDTNDGVVDFVTHTAVSEQTPGQPCLGVPGVDLRIASSGPEVVKGGSTVQVVLSFSNAGTGPQPALNVQITDTLPLGLTCASQSSSVSAGSISFTGSCGQGGTLSWSIPSLAPGANGSIILSLQVSGALSPNTVLASSAGITSNPVEDPSTLANNVSLFSMITEGPADLTVSSTWPEGSQPAPGSQLSYTITYANNGADDASDVAIADQLPSSMVLVSASAPDASFNHATSGNLVWQLPSLGLQESGTITLVVKVLPTAVTGSTLTNQIAISSNPADSPLDNNTETKSLTVGKHVVSLPVTLR